MTSTNDLAQIRTDFSLERTHMAVTRTYFALLRTGIAIAGGGTLITTILAEGWPDWIVGILAGLFIIVGYAIMIAGLQRYIFIADKLAGNDEFRIISPKFLIVLTAVLQIATVAVLILFLFGTNT
jgi:uncharacterized membrane protein YidH (DUF202 family)